MINQTFALVNANILSAKDEGISLRGNKQSELSSYKHMLVREGKVALLTNNISELPNCYQIDCQGALVTPGLIDPHTHLVHGGSREYEIELKLKGATYMEIHEAGGGIGSTVNDTRKAGFHELKEKAIKDLNHMLSLGITSMEAKSGYGLNFKDEIKCLNVVNELNIEHPIDIVSTFMGAHSIPVEHKDNPEKYIDFLCEEMLPYVAKNNLAVFCDVFCEKGVFSVIQSRKILNAAKEYGMKLKIHADEIESIGGAELAAEMRATSADHLMAVSKEGIKRLGEAEVVAVLLPGTSFYLQKNYAPAREFIENNVAVALATDFNPGSCPSDNYQLIMNLGYLYLKMNPKEILNACTLNAAYALGIADSTGSLDVGKKADFIIWDSDNLEYIVYRFGKNHVRQVYKAGRKVYELPVIK